MKKPILAALAFFTVLTGFLAAYTVPEGHVGIERRFGKATNMTSPGLNFKVPYLDSVTELEVRERKNVEELAAATQNQLPISAKVSVNWAVEKSHAMELFVRYGSLEQFESRVLDPKLREASKAALGQFPADQLIRDRSAATQAILSKLLESTKDLPVTITSPQIENISLPQRYVDAVMAKEQAREEAQKERHVLEKQKVSAQQRVQTAEAQKRADIETAQGKAEAVRLQAEAEAAAIKMVNRELSASPLYIDLIKAKAWDGQLPTTVLGSNTSMLMSMK